ncbi:MAG: CheR family methyltransferase [Pedobacter sp.]
MTKTNKDADALNDKIFSDPLSNKPDHSKTTTTLEDGSPRSQVETSASGEDARRLQNEEGFPVVALGASAGGLRALQELFTHLPADTGMAFVVIVHLSSEHESNLPQLLAKYTEMPVHSTDEAKRLAPDQVFVISADCTLTLKDRILQLSERERLPGKFKPIDSFFESLADQLERKSIGVILSGTGSDGTRGIKAIRAGGGITFAQTEESAQFAEMPRNAVLSGSVDFVLTPADIARQLGELVQLPHLPPLPPSEENASADWKEIHRLLSTKGGDFSQYKQGTLRRRISRRMSIHKTAELSEYVAFIKDHPEELTALREDLLIKVTEFFRDAEMFEALEKKVFPKILACKQDGVPIRVWVPGCASGEEVYSLAMALAEFQGESGTYLPMQIFGTDVSEEAIEKARQGFYAQGQLSGVSQERLRKFFLPATGGFKVKKHLREMCIFARQNFISDPPFSRLDLISCRNVLIYFDALLQKNVFPLFHYALNPDGFLVLGSAESISQAGNLFSAVDEKNRIFAKKKTAQRETFASWTYHQAGQPSSPKKVQPFDYRQRKTDEQKLQREVDRFLLRRLDPVAVVVDSALNVVQFRGHTAPFIDPQPGKATLNLLRITRDTLRLDLQALLRKTQEQGTTQVREHLYREADRECSLTLEASPLQLDQELFFLIRFIPGPSRPSIPESASAFDQSKEQVLWQENQRLKKELATSLELLQKIREEKDEALEDLNASNEEVLSSNEELQSINEELETSKEELESSVEELNTVNQELQGRNEELKQSQGDLYTIIQSVQIPFLILNEDLTIRRISPNAERTLNISAGDVGRNVTELKLSFELPDLQGTLLKVIRSGRGEELEILGLNGRWYLLRIDPIEGKEPAKGVVLALFDIDRLKRSIEETEKAYKYSLRIVDTIKDPLLVLDENLRVKKANPAFYQKFQVNPKQTEGKEIFSLGAGQWDLPELRSLLSEILPQSMQMDNFQVEFDFPQLGPRTMQLSARRMKATFSPHEAILLGIADITEQKKIEDYLRRAKQAADDTSRAKSEFLANISHEIRTPMTVIISALNFLEEAPLDPDQNHLVEMASRSAQNLLDLLDDLLDFSKIEVDKIKIHFEPLDLWQNVEDAVDILKLEAEKKGLEFSWHIAEDVPSTVLGDRKRLRQVLVNLVGNALKFTEMGHIDVTLKTSSMASSKDTPALLFSVQDTGIGISAEDITRLFKNFTQLDSSTTRQYGGTGLGLAICRGLVERMGGKIWVESRPGEGSTFFFTLPLQVPNGLAKETSQERESREPTEITSTVAGILSAKILLGEDDDSIRELVGLLLKTWGWEVIFAENGCEALDKHLAENPDLILMDLQMPVMDGLQAVRKIREREAGQGRRVPVIGLTAHARKQERDQCLEAGMDDVLTKPIDLQKMQTLIRGYLER